VADLFLQPHFEEFGSKDYIYNTNKGWGHRAAL